MAFKKMYSHKPELIWLKFSTILRQSRTFPVLICNSPLHEKAKVFVSKSFSNQLSQKMLPTVMAG